MEGCIEFYNDESGAMVAAASSNMVPKVGSLISIKGKTWRVVNVTYALDTDGPFNEERMRANVDLTDAPQQENGNE